MRTRSMPGRLAAAAIAAVATLAGAAAPAGATSTFTLTRVFGQNRLQTADQVNMKAFPSGTGTVFLADGNSGHETDALAASGAAGVAGVGILLTDNGSQVPQDTLNALSDNKATTIYVVGGSASVPASQVAQLQASHYQVFTPFQGASRYDTMQLIDTQVFQASTVGKDAAGNPTAILASGDDAHFVDALSAGGLAFNRHFPVILTNSTSSALQSQAQTVITQLGIKHLIVVGGPSAVPASQYSPPPSGVTQVDVEYGSDRSATSQKLADYAIGAGYVKNTGMVLARGDDGADALTGSVLAGGADVPTVVTDSPTNLGSAAAFASEHASTLTGASTVLGGTAAVPDSQVSSVQSAGQGVTPAKAGTFNGGGNNTLGVATFPTPSSSNTVAAEPTSGNFVEGGLSYNYGPNDTYQLATTSNGSTSCTTDTYTDFQNRLSTGDEVAGNYNPTGTSTFCLDDIAPAPPATVTAAQDKQNGGVDISFPASGTPDVTTYKVYRATATSTSPLSPNLTCPAVAGTPGSSPQTAPGSAWTAIGQVSSTGASTYTANDSTPPPSSGTAPYYCYAVSSVGPSAGGTQEGTAQPAAQNTNSSGNAGVQPGLPASSTTMHLTAIAVQSQVVTLTYNAPVNCATVDGNGTAPSSNPSATSYDYTVTAGGSAATINGILSCGQDSSSSALTNANQVALELATSQPQGTTVTATAKSGTDNNTVCSTTTASGCEPVGDSASTASSAPVTPLMRGLAVSNTTITVTFNEPIACSTVDGDPADSSSSLSSLPTYKYDFTVSAPAPSGGTAPTVSSVKCAGTPSSPGGLDPAVTITLSGTPGPGTVTVTAQTGTDNNTIGSPFGSSAEPAGDTLSVQVS